MRAREFLKHLQETASVGATAAGSVAPVAGVLGSVVRRVGKPIKAKYMNSAPRIERPEHAQRRT